MSSPQPDLSEIEAYLNINVNTVLADVTIYGVSDELSDFIYNERERPKQPPAEYPIDETYKRLSSEYVALGDSVLASVTTDFNRLIAFFRNVKGQFWLRERDSHQTMGLYTFNEFRAMVKSSNFDWVRWCPMSTPSIIVSMPDETTFFGVTDWLSLEAFVNSNSRSNLTLELLSNSERLLSDGFLRSAIIEAVSALEVCVFSFAANPRVDNDERFNASSLKAQVDHLGLSATVRYLLPVIFDQTNLPYELVKGCSDAIDVRNNVVHQGQRSLNREKTRLLISMIRKVCAILLSNTIK